MSTINTIERFKKIIADVSQGNQAAFSRKIKVKQSTINAAIHSKNGIGGKVIKGVSGIGISIDWLLTGEGSMWREQEKPAQPLEGGSTQEKLITNLEGRVADLKGRVADKEEEIARLRGHFKFAGTLETEEEHGKD